MDFINASVYGEPDVVVCLDNTPYTHMHITTHTAPCVSLFGLKQTNNAQHLLFRRKKRLRDCAPSHQFYTIPSTYNITQSNVYNTLSIKLQPFSSHSQHCPILTWQVYVS